VDVFEEIMNFGNDNSDGMAICTGTEQKNHDSGGSSTEPVGAVDVEIDVLSPCLIEVTTGKEVVTVYAKVTDKSEITGLQRLGWSFDWVKEAKDCEIYKIMIQGDSKIQGLVALRDDPKQMAVYARLIESAPHNRIPNKQYEGVGGHLTAIAVKRSADLGYGGYVYFDAKSELVEHYAKVLKATQIGSSARMFIDEVAAQFILGSYTLTEE
jgi:hypothetical protein